MQRLSTLSPAYQAAALAAIKASASAYCPYSNFCVGAALLHADGSVTPGCNWENCTLQVTCAERCAIVAANVAGKRTAQAVAVFGAVRDSAIDSEDLSLTTPCGLCRQMLAEVGQLSQIDLDIILVARGREHAEVTKLSALLPKAFGPADFGVDIQKWAEGPSTSSTATTTK